MFIKVDDRIGKGMKLAGTTESLYGKRFVKKRQGGKASERNRKKINMYTIFLTAKEGAQE